MKYLLLILLLSSCSTKTIEPILSYPAPPKAGPKVAKELRNICRNEIECKYLIEFLQRYEKHYDILNLRIKESNKK